MSTELTARLAALSPRQRAELRDRLASTSPRQDTLTPGQRRLWRTHHACAGRPVDVVCQVVELRGAVDTGELVGRIRAFVQAHEALRTTFARVGDDDAHPVVHDVLPPRLDRTRCADAVTAHGLAARLAAEPFDLAEGPLLRVTVAEGPDRCRLLVVAHNLVFDAWSFELLLDALDGRSDATAPARPFSRSAAEQRRWLAGPDAAAAAAHWAAQVADAPPPLPTDRPRGVDTSHAGARVGFSVGRATADGIAAAARKAAATPYAGWLAVLWAALAEHGGSEDVLLGTFTAGRDRPGDDRVVGYLINVLPVRLRDPGDRSHGARTRAAKAVTAAGLRHAGYPGELIGRPAPDAVFVFDDLAGPERAIAGVGATTLDVDKGVARYDLTVVVYPGADGATGWLEYDTALYDHDTIARLAGRFTALADAAAGEGGGA